MAHDDIDLPLGTLRWGFGSGHGGHNGLRSIIEALQNKEFFRIRLGVGRPPADVEPADYVLHDFEEKEKEVVLKLLERAILSAADFLQHDLGWVQNKYH